MLLMLLMAGCTPLGFARGEYWTGTSTGDVGACPSFEFEIALVDDAVTGTATSEFEWGTALWEIRGRVGSDRQLSLETRTDDPRVPRPRLTWTATYNPVLWTLTQQAEPDCPPRTARLQRR
jgi:hypothetical protein